MERAKPAQIRQSLEIVEQLKRAGIRFVPIPVFDDQDYEDIMEKLHRRIDRLDKACKGCPIT